MIHWPWIDLRGNKMHLARTLGLVALWGAIALMLAVFILSIGLPDIQKAVRLDHSPTVIMRDRYGNEFARLGDVQGEILRVDQMSPWLPKAVIATEDRRFYKHWGVDPFGLARAIITNILHRGGLQGGSTITQQLAKNLFLSPERTITRKVKEALLAIYLERRYTKDEILAAYLNRAYFGGGAYGVDSAARVYFNSSARKLTLQQAAMLAGLLKAPSHYSPDHDPKLTMQRTRTVLGAMVDAGYLKPGSEKMKIDPLPAREYNVGGALDMRYYADWIMSQVDAYTGASSQNLIIDTTLDTRIQKYASNAVRNTVEKDGPKQHISQGAMVMVQPDGEVVAMVGGRDYGDSQYNRATTAVRQPGSSFKPFVYLAALEAGYTPQTQVLDAPIKIGKYAPANYEGKYHGPLALQDAVALSLNTVAIRVAQDIGVGRVINMAQRLGITDPLTPDLSLALGASEVHMLSMAGAYATLANGGLSVEPYGIRSIKTTDGQVLYQRHDVPATQVLNPNIVAEMNHILQGVVTYGTGQGAMIDRPVAGKTGTTSNYRDAWFIGFTSDYVMAVWVGNDDATSMKKVTGGAMPARIWRDIMLAAEGGHPVRALLSSPGPADGMTPVPAHGEMATQQPPVDGAAPPADNNGMFNQLLTNIIGAPDAPQQADRPENIQWDQN